MIKESQYGKQNRTGHRDETCLPMMQIPKRYAVFRPLADVDADKETPQTVIFFADPDELSALVVLANYNRGNNENVFIPYAAGCQTIGIYPYGRRNPTGRTP
jgi:hypothetical protein